MTEYEEKKISKSDSLDLETRARVAFAATAEDVDEEGRRTHQESMNDQEVKSYLEEIMSQVGKKKKEKETSVKVKDTKNNQIK